MNRHIYFCGKTQLGSSPLKFLMFKVVHCEMVASLFTVNKPKIIVGLQHLYR